MTPLNLALSYARLGIPVFPCRAGDEDSDMHDPETGEIIVFKKKTPLISSGFKGATKNERVIKALWERYPNAMVGLPTGEQLGAWVLDIDVHKDDAGKVIDGFATLAAFEKEHGPLPKTAIAKTAGGGRHYYFKYHPGVRNRGKLGAGIDLRGAGGYVISPGSVTDEGHTYEWIDHSGDTMPHLAEAPEWLLELVLPKTVTSTRGEYRHSNGQNTAYVERAVESELNDLASAIQGSRGEQVNKSAFSLGTLVGAGVLSRSEAEAGLFDAAYACGVVAKDGEREIRNKIRRGLDAGIRKPREIPEPEYETETEWHVDISKLVNRGRVPEREQSTIIDDKSQENIPNGNAALSVADDDPIDNDYRLEVVANLDDLTNPGGLVEDMINWIVSSSSRPSRTLALAAVLPTVAALIGPGYASDGEYDTRVNLYTVSLAPSGYGKTHALTQIQRLFMAADGVFDKYRAPERIASATGLRKILETHNSVVTLIDEFGGFMSSINSKSGGEHQIAIARDLRDYYSKSSTSFLGAASASGKTPEIKHPCLCLHGASTPGQFWQATQRESGEDGLLARFMLFNVTGDKPERIKPEVRPTDIPQWILEKMAKVAGIDVAKTRGNLSGMVVLPKSGAKPKIIKFSPDANDLRNTIIHSLEEREKKVRDEDRPYFNRIMENAVKIAMIVAVGHDPVNPVISEAIFEWAVSVSWTCAASMMEQVAQNVAENSREANSNKIAAIIRSGKARGVTKSYIVMRCKSIDERQRNELMKELVEIGDVRVIEKRSDGGGRPSTRYLWNFGT